MNFSDKLLRHTSTVLYATLFALPLCSGCSSAEPPKSPEQIEESRIKHQETSRREMQG